MKDLYQEPECNVVDEARRYVENAKDILNDKGKLDIETQSYRDKKYVRIAGNTLWNGMLLILDAVFDVKAAKKHAAQDFVWPTPSSTAAR